MHVVLHVSHDGPVLHLLPGEFVLGRSSDCNIRLSQIPVSRRHCRLAVEPGRASIRDLGSRNHTVLNSRALTDEQPLRDGDWLEVCDTQFWVRLLPDNRPADPNWLTVRPEGPGVTVGPPADRRCQEAESIVTTPTRIYVSGPPVLGTAGSSERALEYDLYQFLGPAGGFDSDKHEGPPLGIPLLVYDDVDLETWGQKLVAFLTDWGVPDGTAVSLARDVPGQGVVHRRFQVPSRPGQSRADREP